MSINRRKSPTLHIHRKTFSQIVKKEQFSIKMELPGLGESCQATSCKQLDFLPMKCDACGKIFCRDHIHYSTHECPESYKKDNQVPVCPLCNSPIAVKKGELPDVIVGRHIDNDCQSDLAKKRRKIYTNRCSFKGCKHKELIPVNCDKCHQNFCLKHRHELDHQCKGFEDTGRGVSRAAAAAVNRASTSNQPKPSSSNKPKSNQGKPQNTMLAYIGKDLARDRRERQSQPTANNATNSVQGGMSEDEALAHAIQMSMQESQPPAPQKPLTREEEEDLLLAQAISASQQEAQAAQRRQQEAQQNKRSCSLS